MKKNNYPSWLVPVKIAKKLKKIGFNTNTLFFYNEEEEPKIMFGLNTFEEVDGQSDLEIGQLQFYQEADMESYEYILPTWEQVLEWFRNKKIYGNVNQSWEYRKYDSPRGLNYFYIINDCRKKNIKETEAIWNGGFDIYEDAREELVNKLIKLYENNV